MLRKLLRATLAHKFEAFCSEMRVSHGVNHLHKTRSLQLWMQLHVDCINSGRNFYQWCHITILLGFFMNLYVHYFMLFYHCDRKTSTCYWNFFNMFKWFLIILLFFCDQRYSSLCPGKVFDQCFYLNGFATSWEYYEYHSLFAEKKSFL